VIVCAEELAECEEQESKVVDTTAITVNSSPQMLELNNEPHKL
jgi:hypothetical protein